MQEILGELRKLYPVELSCVKMHKTHTYIYFKYLPATSVHWVDQ